MSTFFFVGVAARASADLEPSGVDGRSAAASIAFYVESLISSVAPTSDASCFFTAAFFLVNFFGVIFLTAGFFFGKILIGFFFGFSSSSSSFSSGAEPLYDSAFDSKD